MSEGLDALRRGEIVLMQTDTLVGLHVRADHDHAATRLREMKGSDPSRPFLLLFDHVTSVWPWAVPRDPAQRDLLARAWPGPLTALLCPTDATPQDWIHDATSVGVRVPDLALLRALLRALGAPVYSTSANRAGDSPAADLAAAAHGFPDLVGIDFPTPSRGVASTIVDLAGPRPRVVRPGSAPWPPD